MSLGRNLSAAGLLTICVSVGGWIAYAEGSHKDTRSNGEQIRLITDILHEQRLEAQVNKKRDREQCITGVLDPESDLCKLALAEDH